VVHDLIWFRLLFLSRTHAPKS